MTAIEPDWEARYRERSIDDARPAPVLAEHGHLLPTRGEALDLACGLGCNALYLARHGLTTTAWDRAATAVDQLATRALEEGVPVAAEVRDVVAHPPLAGSFDVVVVTRFLERDLAPALAAALRPGGLLFYQTFNRARVTGHGPRSDRYRLDDNELLRLFPALQLRFYRDEARIGDLDQGLRDEAQFIGQRVAD